MPTVVVAEWWRGRASKRMARLLEGIELEALDLRLCEERRGRDRGSSGCDDHRAIVMASAAQRGDTVFTSDVDDLARLAIYFRGVRVLHV